VLQTNVYIKGSGDGKIIGREMKFHLWFDPTQAFHNYAILWKSSEIMYYFHTLYHNVLKTGLADKYYNYSKIR
jgi:beta-glucanase (GH16 family)